MKTHGKGTGEVEVAGEVSRKVVGKVAVGEMDEGAIGGFIPSIDHLKTRWTQRIK